MHELILIRHIRGMGSCWKSVTRPAQRSDGSDRGCPLDTVIDPPIWHASGTLGLAEVQVQRLPWERPRPQPRLSPYRVRSCSSVVVGRRRMTGSVEMMAL